MLRMLNRCVPHPHPQELRQFWISVHICGLQVWLLQIIPSPPDLELLKYHPRPHQNIENLGILCGLQICANLKSALPPPPNCYWLVDYAVHRRLPFHYCVNRLILCWKIKK